MSEEWPEEVIEEMKPLAKEYLFQKKRKKSIEEKINKIKKELIEIFEEENEKRKKEGLEPLKSFPVEDFKKQLGQTTISFKNKQITYTKPGTITSTTEWGTVFIIIIIEYFKLNPEAITTQLEVFEEQLSTILKKHNITMEQLETTSDIAELLRPLTKKDEAEIRNLHKFSQKLHDIQDVIADNEDPVKLAVEINPRKSYISGRTIGKRK